MGIQDYELRVAVRPVLPLNAQEGALVLRNILADARAPGRSAFASN